MKRRRQTPLEIVARDANFRRGRIIAWERLSQQLVHAVAPESDALIRVVAGMTKALLKHHEEAEVSARSHLYQGDYYHGTYRP